ncbi:unnamed protein product [Bursaphelenchus okinawaensis]|uniref:Lipid-binding serum glycoprotein C-terminal domain-containing protein n=1 Tax=Bursaphelenchus okinawaensis TaxID=465554 RepID=A0A811L4K9_9BILA|nr:unnamed protein product [Bursaphelenchus okinawaensis]CAG9117180.1 unnamed protein product [Bursaphelenchus okinawaensis]
MRRGFFAALLTCTICTTLISAATRHPFHVSATTTLKPPSGNRTDALSQQTYYNNSSLLAQTTEPVGIRVRFNEPVFKDTANVMKSVFAYQAKNARIASYQQCFPEGCFYLHSFRVSGFERPKDVTITSAEPNKLVLKIFAFDIDILGAVTGNIQILLNVPILGQIIVNARQITVTALFDIQKDLQRTPYLHQAGCSLDMGLVNAQVTGMGLITDSVNIKYKKEMVEKAREIISSTVCWNLERAIQDQVNTRLRDMPKHLSIYELIQYFDSSATKVEPQPRPIVAKDPALQYTRYRTHHSPSRYRSPRVKRSESRGVAAVVEIIEPTDNVVQYEEKKRVRKKIAKPTEDKPKGNEVDYVDYANEADTSKNFMEKFDNENTSGTVSVSVGPDAKKSTKSTKKVEDKSLSSGKSSVNKTNGTEKSKKIDEVSIDGTQFNLRELLDGFDFTNFGRLFLNMDFVDSAADAETFNIGISGAVRVNALPYNGLYNDPRPLTNETLLEFPLNLTKKGVEMIVGEFTPNALFNQAHRAKILRFHVNPRTPLFGPMLKTTCTIDEVCLSDSLPEIGEKYPQKQMNILIESVRPPKVVISEDSMKVHFIGLATFFIADVGQQPIGKIPFSATTKIHIKQNDNKIFVQISISELEILEDVDFFELSPAQLRGFKTSVKGALERLANKYLKSGLDLKYLQGKLENYGLNDLNIQLLAEGLIMLQMDVDVYKLLFEDNTLDGRIEKF